MPIVSYCQTNASGVRRALCVMRRPSTIGNNLFKHLLLYNHWATVLKFHMEGELTPGSHNCKIGSGPEIIKLFS